MTRLAPEPCVATLLATSARVEVLDASAAGFTVKTSIELAGPSSKVHDTLAAKVGAWGGHSKDGLTT